MSTSRRLAALVRLDLAEYLYVTRTSEAARLARVLDAFLAFLKKCETSAYNLPWFYNHCPGTVRRLHELGFRAKQHSASARLLLALRTVLWPGIGLLLCILFLARNGGCVRKHFGASVGKQLVGGLYALYRYNVAPSDYYSLRLFNCSSARAIPLYFCQREKDPILGAMQPRSKDIRIANDKVRFFQHCHAAGLPTPDIVAAFSDGADRTTWFGSHKDIPEMDLFRKPPDRFGGSGAELWQYCSRTRSWNSNGRSLGRNEFLEDCARRHCILQPALRNHADLRALAANGLATFRVVTALSAGTGPIVIGALLKIPMGDAVIDAYWAGGLVAGVDMERGTLKAAVARDLCKGRFERHPVNAETIAGRSIPHWKGVLDVAVRGQSSLPGLTSIGWDIAVTDDGVSIVEANVGWNFEMFQVGLGCGLGETKFLEWAKTVLG